MADVEGGGSAMGFRGSPPPPPPPVVPVPGVDAARASAAEALGGLEATMRRASSFSDEERHRSVNGEWSAVDEACEVVRGRLATVRRDVAELTPDELARAVEAHAQTVGGALSVLFGEMTAHNGFVNPDLDLDIIETSRPR